MSNNINIELVLDILGEQVLQVTGKNLSEPEKDMIRGTWENKDYEEIASTTGHGISYLQQKVGPSLWATLTSVIGNGRKVRKANFREILTLAIKNEYIRRLDTLYPDTRTLAGQTKIHGEMPKIESFYGREEDINFIKNQIRVFKQRCIYISGVGGVGKSLFVAKVINKILEEELLNNLTFYDYIIWKSLLRSSTIDDVVTHFLKVLTPDINLSRISSSEKLSLLFHKFSSFKCLLIIDGLENLSQIDLTETKAEIDDFFDTITKEQNLSCLIVTSQLPLKDLSAYTTINLPVLPHRLEGLEASVALKLLQNSGLKGEERDFLKVINNYRGNPSELLSVVQKVDRYFEGNLREFIKFTAGPLGEQYQLMLHWQFGRNGFLTQLQKQILIYLAQQMSQNHAAIPFSNILHYLKTQSIKVLPSQVITDIEILEERLLVEASDKDYKFNNQPTRLRKKEPSYTLPPAVKNYILIDPLGLVRKSLARVRDNNYMEAG